MPQMYEFAAPITAQSDAGADTRTITARLVPFGESAPYGGRDLSFARGSLTVPDDVPLTVDHGRGVASRIGVLTRYIETDDGAYAEFTVADTAAARDTLALLEVGAVRDVSIGVLPESDEVAPMRGSLDHVSIVTAGRFGDATQPSRVLQVNEGDEPMPEPTTTKTPDTKTPDVVENEAAPNAEVVELRSEVERLTELFDGLDTDDGPDAEFSGDEVFEAMVMRSQGIPIVDNALADVIGDLGSADASGLSPDWYWAQGLQANTDRRRPLFSATGSAPFPTYGNNLQSAKVTQETSVAARTGQKAAVASQALQVSPVTYPIVWFAGAVDVALELMSQSNPEVTGVISRSLLAQYAAVVEADCYTKAKAAAVHSGAALPVDTYANLVAAIISTSNLIEDATGMPGDRVAVSPTDWGAILGLMDGGDRRQFAVVNPQNADGSGSLTTRGIDIGGIFTFRSAAATSALQYNETSLRTAEKNPMAVFATNVELMGRDQGILGGTVVVHWDEGVYSYEIV